MVSKDPYVSFEVASTTFVTGTYENVEKITDELFQNIENEVKNLWIKILPK